MRGSCYDTTGESVQRENLMRPSRRTILTSGVIAAAASGAASAATRPKAHDAAWLQSVVERYAAFGGKASGGPGDEACGAWLEAELTRAGYACERQSFEVPYFDPATATLVSGEARATVIPQALVSPTGPSGMTGPLRRPDRDGDMEGAIAILDLPYTRWGGIGQIAKPVADAFGRGAVAAVAITNGPSGEAVALNVSPHKPGFDRPVAILAPKDAAPFLAAAASGSSATLTVDGRGGKRPAYNLIARRDRKAAKTFILSTPRSGWFDCVAERGSGLAVWLALAHWLASAKHQVNLELVATSGHEYVYLGGEHYLSDKAPKPERTKLWMHIGACLAARDWHDIGPTPRPLSSADAGRAMVATPDQIERLRRAFKGQSGLQDVYIADKTTAAGEIVNVIDAKYPSAIGEYGYHRYFHTAADDLRCTSGDLIAPVLAAYRTALAACLRA
ncbi:MAG: M28 family peptidase [Alphaproteobacteria bacterium]|nr:M28 family peptidase [Alphaproteobacteria bacterium]